MLPVKNRFPNCDFRGGQISQPLVLWLIWVLASTLDPSASEINKALSVTYKLLFILSKNIVPSRSYRYIRDRAFPVTRLPPPYIYKVWCKATVYLGAGKHPGPLCIKNKWSPSLLPISCFLSCQKILFLAEVIAISEIAHFLWLLATPYIYKVWCKQRYIWVLASTLDPSVSQINEALSVTYKLLFILSKNIVPSRSYRYIRDRAFPVTACHPLYIQSLM